MNETNDLSILLKETTHYPGIMGPQKLCLYRQVHTHWFARGTGVWTEHRPLDLAWNCSSTNDCLCGPGRLAVFSAIHRRSLCPHLSADSPHKGIWHCRLLSLKCRGPVNNTALSPTSPATLWILGKSLGSLRDIFLMKCSARTPVVRNKWGHKYKAPSTCEAL